MKFYRLRPLRGLLSLVLTVAILSAFLGCSADQRAELPGASPEDKAKLTRLMKLMQERLINDPDNMENRFILWEQIISLYQKYDRQEELTALLGDYTESHPDDPFNGYYLYTLAASYEKRDKHRAAEQYYTLLLNNYPDLRINKESLHFLTLRHLIQILEDPYRRLHYYQEINQRYPGKLEPGVYHYYLAQTYEEIGEWEKAMDQYQAFLNYPDTIIQGKPDIQQAIKSKVDFYNSDKSWARESLTSLIASIKYATRTLNLRALRSYQSRVNFFMLSWDHAEDSAYTFTRSTFNIRPFLRSGIRFAPTLDADSNEREAYLRSTGWSYIGPWYFYFRKVDFPADPEINGRWEWAGIYFGEKL